MSELPATSGEYEAAPGRVAVGTVRRPWGLRGAVTLTVYSANPSWATRGSHVFASGRELTVVSAKRVGSGGLAVKFAEISSPEDAGALRGAFVEVLTSDLPKQAEGVYYHYQIVGSRVVTASGQVLGRVSEIIESPANDVYVVTPDDGGEELLVPALGEVVRSIDVAGGVITVDLPTN